MTIQEIGGIFGILSMVFSLGIWLFKRGADVGAFSARFGQFAESLNSLRRRQDSAEKSIKLLVEDSVDGGVNWSVKKLKEDVRGIIEDSRNISDSAKQSEVLAREALEQIKKLDEENDKEHGKNQAQIILLAKQIRAIIEHLNENVRNQKTKPQ